MFEVGIEWALHEQMAALRLPLRLKDMPSMIKFQQLMINYTIASYEGFMISV